MYLSIDQGLANIGLTVFNLEHKLIYKEYITTDSFDTSRFKRIKFEIEEIIKEFEIKFIICEDLMIFDDKNNYGVKQSIKITGIIQCLAQEYNCFFYELPLRAIKSFSGKGNLSKEDSMQITGETNDHISDSILIFNYFKNTYLHIKTEIEQNFK